MPAKDRYHDAIKNALIKDGWRIIRDPYTIKYQEVQLFADLLVDKTLEIEKDGQQIIVEIKSFIGRSPMREFETALGQYIIYRTFLRKILPQSQIYLAIGQDVYKSFFRQKAIQTVIQKNQIYLIIISLKSQEIIQWVN
jgi:hypothetical protein